MDFQDLLCIHEFVGLARVFGRLLRILPGLALYDGLLALDFAGA